ncbi:MAG TPA: hypothetical protein PLL10_05995 [Elusimicrobiales bacterium]|nr:hypothetical protein [Elusimicrobiales bacterium]
MSWNAAFLPLLGLLVDALVLVALARRGVPLLKSVYGGFLVGALFVLGADTQAGAGFALGAADLLAYGALGYGFFHFINMGETARRIRLILEIKESGGLSEAELLGRYPAAEILRARLVRLERNGQLKLRDGRYVLGAGTVLFMARALTAMKRFMLGRDYAERLG